MAPVQSLGSIGFRSFYDEQGSSTVELVLKHFRWISLLKILAHVKPAQRRTWSTHVYDAWYVGTAMEHYKSYTV
jgi:hypothetical protein